MSNTILAAAGTDGVVPIYDPAARFQIWALPEIYKSTGIGAGKYVPKVNDLVEDLVNNITYKVTAVDPVTLDSTMVVWRSFGVAEDALSDDNLVIGPLLRHPAETHFVYLDTSVIPYVLAVDACFTVPGSSAKYVKIFKGNYVTDNANVISQVYDQAGTLVGQNVPLELLVVDSHTNYAIKGVPVCYTNQALVDGEIVTIAAYSDTGNIVMERVLRIVNTTFTRKPQTGQKYVSGISLKSPFMSATSDHVLEYPLNLPLSSLNLIGVVHYSDGSTSELPVDGSRFQVFGLEQYIATEVGQQVDIVLAYTLGNSELAYRNVDINGKTVTEDYTLVTVAQKGAYSVKLYAYPQWIDSNNGYSLRWFLYNLDRNIWYDVTSLVAFNSDSQSFKPTTYGTRQDLSVRINLADVSASFEAYVHVQTITVILQAQGTQRSTNWLIGFEPTQSPMFGVALAARAQMTNANLWKLRLGSALLSQDQWLKNVYYNTKPLYNVLKEVNPPVPTHFSVQIGDNSYDFPISAWNDELSVGAGLAINGTVFIRFIRRTQQSDMQLSMAAMPVYEY